VEFAVRICRGFMDPVYRKDNKTMYTVF